jgi:hypothetical protein
MAVRLLLPTASRHQSGEGEESMQTVADQFAEMLVAAGVKRIYEIVGDSLNGLTDAIRRQGKIEWVHVRHPVQDRAYQPAVIPVLR